MSLLFKLILLNENRTNWINISENRSRKLKSYIIVKEAFSFRFECMKFHSAYFIVNSFMPSILQKYISPNQLHCKNLNFGGSKKIRILLFTHHYYLTLWKIIYNKVLLTLTKSSNINSIYIRYTLNIYINLNAMILCFVNYVCMFLGLENIRILYLFFLLDQYVSIPTEIKLHG